MAGSRRLLKVWGARGGPDLGCNRGGELEGVPLGVSSLCRLGRETQEAGAAEAARGCGPAAPPEGGQENNHRAFKGLD